MKRMHLIEIGDEPWCPAAIRHGVTDYCQFIVEVSHAYRAAVPLLADALRRTGSRRVLDLCSGAGGPWLGLLPLLRAHKTDVTVCLSDHNPNREAFERIERLTGKAVTYRAEPVDATAVPADLAGFRTIFTAFHHLRPEQARAVLTEAVARGEGIGVFEPGRRNLLLLPFALMTVVRVLLVTPFIRPFRWSRLFWTYVVPVLPLVLTFDVVVSILRLYSELELRELTAGLDGYCWNIGMVRNKPIPIAVVYLIGLPRRDADTRRPEDDG